MTVRQQEQLHIRDLVMTGKARTLRIAQVAQVDVSRPKLVVVISAVFLEAGESVSNGLRGTAQRAAGDAQKPRLR
jgi:hypothetical protein